jgi:hypothetical protein
MYLLLRATDCVIFVGNDIMSSTRGFSSRFPYFDHPVSYVCQIVAGEEDAS